MAVVEFSGSTTSLRAGVNLLVMDGPVALDDVLGAIAVLRDNDDKTRALLIDFRNADFMLAERDWDVSVRVLQRWGRGSRPGAVIVRAEDFSFFLELAGRLARHGLVLCPFINLSEAAEWAAGNPPGLTAGGHRIPRRTHRSEPTPGRPILVTQDGIRSAARDRGTRLPA